MVSRIGVGLYSLAGVYGIKDPEEIKRMLLQAVEWGVDYFDVADQYGPAEELLGETLQKYRSQINISTKVGLTGDGGRDCSYKHLLRACEKSLSRLKTDYIDLYQIHFDDPHTPIDETLSALDELKRRGWIKDYGIGHLARERIIEYCKNGVLEWVMLELNPLALKTYLELYSYFVDKGIKIIAMGSTGRGLLTGKIKPGHNFEAGDIRNIDPLFQRGLLESGYRVLQKLEDLGNKYGKTSVQICLNWLNQLPGVERILVGPSTIEHLRENLGGWGWQMEREDFDDLTRFLLKEEEKRRVVQRSDIEEILGVELGNDRQRVVADMVYVICALLELEKVTEKEVLSLYSELMTWKKLQGEWGEVMKLKNKLIELI